MILQYPDADKHDPNTLCCIKYIYRGLSPMTGAEHCIFAIHMEW